MELSPSHTGSSMPNDDRRTITQYIISIRDWLVTITHFEKKISKCADLVPKLTHFEYFFQYVIFLKLRCHNGAINKTSLNLNAISLMRSQVNAQGRRSVSRRRGGVDFSRDGLASWTRSDFLQNFFLFPQRRVFSFVKKIMYIVQSESYKRYFFLKFEVNKGHHIVLNGVTLKEKSGRVFVLRWDKMSS